MNKKSDRQDAQWGKPVRPMPDPDDHWLVRLSLVDDEIDAKPIRAKPQTIKRLTLKKDDIEACRRRYGSVAKMRSVPSLLSMQTTCKKSRAGLTIR